MFYAHFVLAKKGPLARIWLAAHWDKKLTKAHVFETNIESSVEGILQPKVKMALRTSGHLLLGIVRIYSRKAKYLLADCNEAFIKIKMAFRPGVVDLPEENREAAVQSITLPEVFHDFDIGMPDLPAIDMEAAITLNQSRAEDITLKEDYGMGLMNDEEQLYADMSFDADADIGRDATQLDFDSQSVNLTATEISSHVSKENAPSLVGASQLAVGGPGGQSSLDAPLNDDGFGGNLESAGLELENDNETRSELYPPGPGGTEPEEADASPAISDSESDYDMGPGGSMGVPSPPSSADGEVDDLDDINVQPPSLHDGSSQHGQAQQQSLNNSDSMTPTMGHHGIAAGPMGGGVNQMEQSQIGAELGMQATIAAPPAPREEPETFTLAPLDASTVEQHAGPAVRRIPNRKRKLIIDEVKNISGEEMKSQLSDTSDIVTTLDLAPPTKRLMHWKETGGVEKLLSLPAVENRHSKYLQKLYQVHLVTRSVESDESLVAPPVPEETNEESDPVRERAESRLDDTTTSQVSGNTAPPETPAAKRSRMEDVPPTPGRDFMGDMGYQHAPATDYGGAPYTPFTPAPATPAHPQGDYNNTFPTPGIGSEEMSANFDSLQTSQQQSNSGAATAANGPGSMAPPQTPMHPPPTPMHHPPATPMHGDLDHEDGPLDLPQHHHDDSDEEDAAQDQKGRGPSAAAQAAEMALGADEVETELPHIDEQADDETFEEFEERIQNRRTIQLLRHVKPALDVGRPVRFADLIKQNNNRKQVAQKFYTFLVLKKQQAIELTQQQAYDELYISVGPKYHQAFAVNE
ncbi:double-strand-break repair protein rad21-like [Tropilaelaps mercedesae]|uniref:Double-strand-break repair protein rad21-like n=1 Tax=Tropilaelaps mercedesae TaxID=418985 RepID=A0A1V9XC91_9ACAR|nr:double-strand-break repair protein rad21-like [Tropilaelaps mercedesae]